MAILRDATYVRGPSLVASYESESAQFVNYHVGVFFNSTIYRIKSNFRIFWRLIWIVNACESFDLPAPRFGINAFYISVFQSTASSSGRLMYEDSDVADLITKSHIQGIEVWAAYGNTDWAQLGCSSSAFPMQRMEEVVGYNSANPTAKFDGVILDVEPPDPQTESEYQDLLELYD